MTTGDLGDPYLWQTLPLFPDYRIGRSGSVVSLIYKKPRVLKQSTVVGYFMVSLRDKHGNIKNIHVHRLVAEAFLGPCPKGMQCRHLDGVPKNNSIYNLRWGTNSENEHDKRRHGTAILGEKNHASKLSYESVAKMKKIRERTGRTYTCIAKEFGVTKRAAWQAITGRTWV